MVADVDGDGLDDVVTCAASGWPDSVTVRRSLAAGGFAPIETHPTSEGPVDLEIVDIDGDGRLDIVVANGQGQSVSVLPGVDGGLGGAVTHPLPAEPVGLSLADLDGDGVLDLAVGSQAEEVHVLRGHADFSFEALNSFEAAEPYRLLLEDVDADGVLDLLLGSDATLVVRRGLSSGVFGPPVGHAIARMWDLELVDLNGDGLPDIVAGCPAGARVGLNQLRR